MSSIKMEEALIISSTEQLLKEQEAFFKNIQDDEFVIKQEEPELDLILAEKVIQQRQNSKGCEDNQLNHGEGRGTILTNRKDEEI